MNELDEHPELSLRDEYLFRDPAPKLGFRDEYNSAYPPPSQPAYYPPHPPRGRWIWIPEREPDYKCDTCRNGGVCWCWGNTPTRY